MTGSQVAGPRQTVWLRLTISNTLDDVARLNSIGGNKRLGWLATAVEINGVEILRTSHGCVYVGSDRRERIDPLLRQDRSVLDRPWGELK